MVVYLLTCRWNYCCIRGRR